jgi:hypothetical protein
VEGGYERAYMRQGGGEEEDNKQAYARKLGRAGMRGRKKACIIVVHKR